MLTLLLSNELVLEYVTEARIPSRIPRGLLARRVRVRFAAAAANVAMLRLTKIPFHHSTCDSFNLENLCY